MNKELCIQVGKWNNSILWRTVEKTSNSIILVFWVIAPYSLANIYWRFEEASFLYIHNKYCLVLKNEAPRFSEVTVTFHEWTLCNFLKVLNLRRHGNKKFKFRATDFFTQNVNSAILLNRHIKSGPFENKYELEIDYMVWEIASNGFTCLHSIRFQVLLCLLRGFLT